MSVLATKRTVSKAQYVNKASEIYVETIKFLTRLSARYSRLIAEPIAKLAGEVLDECEKANSIYPSDDSKKKLRETHLLEARASLRALDVRLGHCYLILQTNPQGCFSDTIPTHDGDKARIRIDRLSEKLGLLLDEEDTLIRRVMDSDRRRKS